MAAKSKDKKPHPVHEKVLNGKRYKSAGALLIATSPETAFPAGMTRYLLRSPKGAYFMLIEQAEGAKEKDILPFCWESAYQQYLQMRQEVPESEAFPSGVVDDA